MAGWASMLAESAQNPFTSFLANNSNALRGVGVGLASGPDFNTGVSNAVQYAAQGRQQDDALAQMRQEEQKRLEELNQTVSWARSTFPDLAQAPDNLVAEVAPKLWMESLMNKGGSQSEFQERFAAGQQYGLSGDALNTFALTGSVPGTTRSNVTYGTTPVWGRDSTTGQMGYGVTGSDGTFKMVDTGGFQPLGPYDVNAEKAAGTAFGKETGGAQFDLPSAELATTQTLAAIEAIRSEKKGMDEQFGNILGVPQQLTPAVPGTDKAKFQVAVERGTNLAFMQAREMLRGGGQITDFESRKAETAITNMQLAMEKGDKAQFEAALNTFEQAVRDGMTKIKQQAGTMPGYRGAPAGGGAAPAVDDILSKYGL